MGEPLAEFLDNPKPYSIEQLLPPAAIKQAKDAGTFHDFSQKMRLEFTGRVVSKQPFVLDVLDVRAAPGESLAGSCGPTTIALVDSRLKSVLAGLQFNEVVHAGLIWGGTAAYPHEVVMTELSPLSTLPSSGNCANASGMLFAYREEVETVEVFQDGAIHYCDPLLHCYNNQKLSGEELADLLRAFGQAGFDAVPSELRPMGNVPDRNSLTLICRRDQYVSLPGKEALLAPLLEHMEALKKRATSQLSYVLMYKQRLKQKILEWPYPQMPLSEFVAGRPRAATAAIPLEHELPADLLSETSDTDWHGKVTENPQTFWKSAGRLYRVSAGRQCKRFACISVYEVREAEAALGNMVENPKNPTVGTSLAVPTAIFWPAGFGVRLAEGSATGRRISPEEYDQNSKFYFQLVKIGGYGMGLDMIEDGYLYRGVRICRVEPQEPKTLCTEMYEPKK
jgi:hypothetical protein